MNPNEEGARKMLIANYKVMTLWLLATTSSILYLKVLEAKEKKQKVKEIKDGEVALQESKLVVSSI